MPIFEYTCRACGVRFEELVKSASAKSAGCPQCGSKRVAKEFSSFSASVAPSGASACASGDCGVPAAGGCGGCGSSGGCPFK